MSTIPTPTIKERAEHSVKEQSSRSRPERFKEHYREKVEKTEEREEKRQSIFDIIAEQNPLAAPASIFSLPSIELQTSLTICPLSDVQCDMIVEQTSSAITHIIENGIKETTVRLDGEWLTGSPLQGAEITITEYNTSPLMFNVVFRCSPTAMAHLMPHLSELSAALHSQKKDYLIHRVEAELEDSSQFLFHRKPALSGDTQDQQM